MAKPRVSMNTIREAIRLHTEGKLSQRQIARALGVSRPALSQYLADYRASGLAYSAVVAMSDDDLLKALEGVKESVSERYRDLAARFEYFVKELKRTGVTLDLLWEEYKRAKPDGYNRTQFCHHFRVWRESEPELTMHLEHKAGERMFVDYPGKKFMVYDPLTGAGREVETLVAILGASQLTYAEATESQKKEDWINSNEHALRYFGGVPEAIVPDCLRSAVERADKYEPDINPEYADFGRHHNTVILPARPHSPRDKALAENAVKLIYQRVFAPLRDRIFCSVPDLNAAIWERLDVHNHTHFQRMNISRWDLFNEIERSALKPLRPDAYELRRFLSLKVQFNYHCYFSPDKHYYSVPYRYSGKQVTVIYTGSVVEFYHKNLRIAVHQRNYGPNRYTTLREHMPPHHQFYDSWSPEKMIGWADQVGPEAKAMIEAVLESRPFPEQAYKACLGILNLARKYGKERLNEACRRALTYRAFSYRSVRNILEAKLDTLPDQHQEEARQRTRPVHANIRGTKYFQ